MKPLLQSLKEHFVSLLYPSGYACLLCDRETVLPQDGICDDCRKQLRFCNTLSAPPSLDGLRAVYCYDTVLHAPMHRFKYGGATWLARFFFQDITLPSDWVFDAVVPVPMHPLKAYYRKYNPPEALALALREMQPHLTIRTDLIKKVKLTRSQTTLSAKQRAKNVKDAFRASPDAKGLSILLIDDVTTTHSTLIACARALKAQGAKRIYALCACSAVQGNGSMNDVRTAVL